MKQVLLLLSLLPIALAAQTNSGPLALRPVPCNLGQQYIATDVAQPANIYTCTSGQGAVTLWVNMTTGVPAGNNGDLQMKNGAGLGASPINCTGGNCSDSGNLSVGTTVLAPCNGVNDTAALNVAFAMFTHPVLTGPTCVINGQLILHSNSTIEARGVTISYPISGSPMVTNYANTLAGTAYTNCAISSSSNPTTLTCTGGAFVAGNVGNSVYIAGADYSGQTLCVQITGVTSSSVVTVSRAATTTVTGATATVYAHDSNITILGGNWTALTPNLFMLWFQHIDGLTVADAVITATASNTGDNDLTFGDATQVEIFNTAISGAGTINVRGPTQYVSFRDVTTTNTDDGIALNAHDTAASQYDWARGPISNVLIDGHRVLGSGTGIKLAVPSVTTTCNYAGITIRNVYQQALSTQPAVQVGGYTSVSGLLIENINISPLTNRGINLQALTGQDATVRNVFYSPAASTSSPVGVFVTTDGISGASSWTSVDVSGVVMNTANTNAYAFNVAGSNTVTSASIRNFQLNTSGSGFLQAISNSGTIGTLLFDDFRTATGGIVPLVGSGTIGGILYPVHHPNGIQSPTDLTQAVWALGAATTTATQITVTGSGANSVKQIIQVTPGLYVFSFLAKSGTLAVPKYSVFDQTHSADLVSEASYASLINSSTWTLVSVPFLVPSGTSQIAVYVMRDGTTTGTVNVTNVQIQ